MKIVFCLNYNRDIYVINNKFINKAPDIGNSVNITTFTDNGDGTVTFAANDTGDATDAAPKDENDAGAGSITVSATDGSDASFPYESPGDSPTARKVNPSTVS